MKKTNNWFDFAKEDLAITKVALKEKLYNQVCFHSQQGVEKMLKGFLKSKNKIVPKIHYLPDLLTLCAEIEDSFESFRQVIVKLADYYIITRYPDVLAGISSKGLPTEKDAKEALKFLKEIIKFVKGKVFEC